MEHNMDDIIRTKITSLDSIPVEWNKSQSWENIQAGMTVRKSFSFLSIAAVIILLILFATNDTTEIVGVERLKVSNLIHDQKRQSSILPIEEKCRERFTPPTITKTLSKQDVKKIVLPAITVPVEVLVTLAVDSIALNETVTESFSIKPKTGIRPVMGVIPFTENNIITTHREKKRKVHFHIQKEEFTPENINESGFIIARIK